MGWKEKVGTLVTCFSGGATKSEQWGSDSPITLINLDTLITFITLLPQANGEHQPSRCARDSDPR
jgi:hypothetical protein